MIFIRLWHYFLFFFIFSLSIGSHASYVCGNVYKTDHVGPWDYGNPYQHSKKSTANERFDSNVQKVEAFHFNSNVKTLKSGVSGSIIADLNYTLQVFPNHYEALWVLVKYDRRMKGALPQLNNGFPQTVDCYFSRAFQFRPKDPYIRQLYGAYFHVNKKLSEALKQYNIAAKNLDTDEFNYNFGLLYFDLKDYENAKLHAQKAYKLKYPLKGLKRKLKSVGVSLDK